MSSVRVRVRFSVWIFWGLSCIMLMSGGVHHKFPHKLQTLAQCHTTFYLDGPTNLHSFVTFIPQVEQTRMRVSEWVYFIHWITGGVIFLGEQNHYINVFAHFNALFSFSLYRSFSYFFFYNDTFWNSPHKLYTRTHTKHEWLFWL